MKRHSYYYLSNFIALTDASDQIVDFTILKKHNYLLILSEDKSFLISSYQYVPNSFVRNKETELCQLKAKIKDSIYIITDISDIIGFEDFDVALNFCRDDTDCLCSEPGHKLIFSPQLTKYLLKNKFRIIDIKEKNDGSKQIIHVFLIEPGFYDCIKKWKEMKNNEGGTQ